MGWSQHLLGICLSEPVWGHLGEFRLYAFSLLLPVWAWLGLRGIPANTVGRGKSQAGSDLAGGHEAGRWAHQIHTGGHSTPVCPPPKPCAANSRPARASAGSRGWRSLPQPARPEGGALPPQGGGPKRVLEKGPGGLLRCSPWGAKESSPRVCRWGGHDTSRLLSIRLCPAPPSASGAPATWKRRASPPPQPWSLGPTSAKWLGWGSSPHLLRLCHLGRPGRAGVKHSDRGAAAPGSQLPGLSCGSSKAARAPCGYVEGGLSPQAGASCAISLGVSELWPRSRSR